MATSTPDIGAIQTGSQALMQTQYNVVTGFLNELQGFINDDTITVSDVPEIDSYLIQPETVQTALGQVLDIPVYPGNGDTSITPLDAAPTVSIDAVPAETPPDFTALPPAVNIPSAPDATLPSAPQAPTLNPVTAPQAPSITLPPAPTFSPIALPSALGLNLPTFDYAAPISDLTAPTESFAFNEQDYTSALSDAVKAKLMSDIENGGYGIEPADEKALWDRARERASAEANAAIEQAMDTYASRGMPLPPGAMLATIADAQQKALEDISEVDREIALKRADMYVENRKVSLQLATEVEGLFINYRSAMMERMLNAAKALVELGIAVFNAKRDKYLADLEAFKTYAMVYESKIRGELAKVELFRSQVEAARVQAEMQMVQAQVYRTQVEALISQIEIYKGQMEGARLAFELERGKLEVFNGQVQAYAAQIEAKNAAFNLYRAQIQGEEAKIEVFDAQARGYQSQIAGFAAKVQALDTRARSQALVAQANTQIYAAKVEKYRADIQRVVAELSNNVEIYKTQVSGNIARAAAVEKAAELGISFNRANLEGIAKSVDQKIALLTKQTDQLLHLLDTRVAATKAGTDAATSLAVAASQQLVGITSAIASS